MRGERGARKVESGGKRVPAAIEGGGKAVEAITGILGAKAALEPGRGFLKEEGDGDGGDVAGIVDEAFRVFLCSAGGGIVRGSEVSGANTSAMVELKGAEAALEKKKAVKTIVLVKAARGEIGGSAVFEETGGGGEEAGGGVAVFELPGVGDNPGVEGLRRDGIKGNAGIKGERGNHLAGGGGIGMDDVFAGVIGVGDVVVYVGGNPWEMGAKDGPETGEIGAVHTNGMAAGGDETGLVIKRSVVLERGKGAGDGMVVDADGLGALGAKDAAKGDLGANAVAIGTHVPEDDNAIVAVALKEGEETGSVLCDDGGDVAAAHG